jgi:hypothetical protein
MEDNEDDPDDIRPIPGHRGYLASAIGKIFSERQGSRKELTPSLVKGYLSVTLMGEDGRPHRQYVHLLVCRTFRGPRPSPAHQARHLDSDPLNRKSSNVAWGLPGDQMADRKRNGRGIGGALCPRPTRPTSRGRGLGKTGLPPADPRPLPNYDGYFGSADGRIFSGKGLALMEMSLGDDEYGNPTVNLSVPGKRGGVLLRVCTLICTAYRGPKPGPNHQVRHADNDTRNCAASNLSWGTARDNMDDRVESGALAGENHGRAVLTGAQVAEARALRSGGASWAELGRLYGVHPNTVKRACSGATWGHLDPSAAPGGALPELPPAPPMGISGEAHWNHRLTEAQALDVVRRGRLGEDTAGIAALHGIDRQTVNKIVRGDSWGYLQDHPLLPSRPAPSARNPGLGAPAAPGAGELRVVPSCPEFYASEGGEVFARRPTGWRGRSPNVNPQGKLQLTLTRINADGERESVTDHLDSFVCSAWHGERPAPDSVVLHADGDQMNCRPDNLSWASKAAIALEALAGHPHLLPIPNFPGYGVDESGQVFTAKGAKVRPLGRNRSKQGHWRTTLFEKVGDAPGRTVTRRIDFLACSAHNGAPPDPTGWEAAHANGDLDDCTRGNLSWRRIATPEKEPPPEDDEL